MHGWVKIHRDIMEHWLWGDKPFSKGQAWVDIILLCNHEERKVNLGNEVILVEKGQFITSQQQLMDRWGWSKSKVINFLKTCEKDSMLCVCSDKKKTTLKVLNYSIWQESETSKEPQEDHGETTERPRKDTNKNVKKDKNVKNGKKKDIFFSEDSLEFKLSLSLRQYILKNNEKARVPEIEGLQTWCSEFDKILRIDKRELEDLKKVLVYSQTDSFWQSNVLSPSKLREKFDTLLMQSNNKQKPKTSEATRGRASEIVIAPENWGKGGK